MWVLRSLCLITFLRFEEDLTTHDAKARGQFEAWRGEVRLGGVVVMLSMHKWSIFSIEKWSGDIWEGEACWTFQRLSGEFRVG